MYDPQVESLEFQLLSNAVYDLFKLGAEPECLNSIFRRASAIFPFQQCMVLHTISSHSNTVTFRHDFVATDKRDYAPVFAERHPDSVQQHLATLDCDEMSDNAFFWQPDLSSHRQRFHGVGAISPGAAQALPATMVLFSFATPQDAPKYLRFARFIALVLHSSLVANPKLFPSTCGLEALSPREHEVIKWVVAGKTSWEVGKILTISERTVKFHLKNIYEKFNVTNRAQAVSFASRQQLR
jgi:DNA-binding CsgD family transcriptional regulator